MENLGNCWNCPHKFNCYDRMVLGRQGQCRPEEHKQNIVNWKWFELYAETPAERKMARQNYIILSNAINNK